MYFILGGSKIIADGNCSHEIKSCLLLGRKFMTNLGSISKSRDITLPTKVRLVKVMVFPVVTYYGCESWTVKKAERRRIDAFELWCWRRPLRIPWTVGYQAPPSSGFSRQECWSGSSWPRNRTWVSHSAGRRFTSEPPGKPLGNSNMCEV